MGLFLIFLAGCMLADVLVSTGNYTWRHQQQSTGIFLLQNKMEEQRRGWIADYGTFGSPFGGYAFFRDTNTWNFTGGNYPWLMGAQDVSVYGPSGATVSGMIIQSSPIMQGIAAVGSPAQVAYVSHGWPRMTSLYNDGTAAALPYPTMPVWQTPTPTPSPTPAHQGATPVPPPDPLWGEAAGLVANKDMSRLYVSDTSYWGYYTINNPWSGAKWPGTENFYCEVEGMALDLAETELWTAGKSSRTLYRYDLVANSWTGPFAPKDPIRKLQAPWFLYLTSTGSDLWIADVSDLCLRHYQPTGDVWDPVCYRPPLTMGRMGLIRGLAGPDTALYMVDAKNLWQYAPGAGTWSVWALPSALQYHVFGMAWDRDTNQLWMVTDNSNLYCVTPGSPPTFVQRL